MARRTKEQIEQAKLAQKWSEAVLKAQDEKRYTNTMKNLEKMLGQEKRTAFIKAVFMTITLEDVTMWEKANRRFNK